jgi:hypothetical protein
MTTPTRTARTIPTIAPVDGAEDVEDEFCAASALAEG